MVGKWVLRIALMLPAVALAVWPFAEQLRVWRAPDSAYEVDWPASNTSNAVDCWAADVLPDVTGYTVEPADDAFALTRVSLDAATVTARRTVANVRGWVFFRYALYGAGPQLVYLTAPDGVQHLTWARMLIVDEGGARGTGDLVYVDARGGDPVLLVRDIAVVTPARSCGRITGEFERVVDPLLSLIGLGIYVLLVIFVGAVSRLWRIQRDKRKQASA